MAPSFQSLLDAARPPLGAELLLGVIAGDDRAALSAWAEWRRSNAIAGARSPDHRLLPAVRRRLSELEIGADDRSALAAVSRHVWLSNQLRLRGQIWILERLAAAGLPMMLLKGGARIASEKTAMEIRVVRDIDILFPPDRLVEAIEVLIASGLRSVNGRLPGAVKSQPFAPLRFVAERPADYLEIDVHAVPLRLGHRGNWDEGVWRRAERAELLGVPVLVPSASDRYLQAIAHGLVADDESPVDWAMDALIALRDRRFDPSIVAAEIGRRRLGVPLAIGSTILRDTLGVDVPDSIFQACQRDIESSLFRSEMAATMMLSKERPVLLRLTAGIAEGRRSFRQSRPTRTWNTAWLFQPTLRRPASWVCFSEGVADVPLSTGLRTGRGRLTVFIEGRGIASTDRSFDVTIDGIWVGRARIRTIGVLRQLPFTRMCVRVRYRVPRALHRAGPTRLTVAALDENKMPATTPLPDIRVAAEVADDRD